MVRLCTLLVAVALVSPVAFAQQVIIDRINGAQQLPPPPPPPPGGGPVMMPVGPGGMPPRDNSVRTGTARIRGRVFASDNGAPIRKAQVRLLSPETRENRLATTDAQGFYEFKDLPAGRYSLTANKGSFVSLQYG